MGALVPPTGTSLLPTGTPAGPYRTAGATYWNPSGPIWIRWCNLPGIQRTHTGALVRPAGVAQRSKTAADVYKSGTSGAGGTKFSLGGTQRTHKDLLVQPTGDQQTHMGRRVQTTGTSADPHGPLVQPTGTIAEAIWIRSGPIWVRWCSLPGRQQTHR